jgi:PadR family transcriptional regulator, regulatory protein AphA
MPKINKTKYAILGVLTLQSASGYDIKGFCDSSISMFWNENFGHIYPVLKQMEADGLVTKTIEQNSSHPQRHVYSITQKGREQLTDWLMEPAEQSPARLELLLKLFFAKNAQPGVILAELERKKGKYLEFQNQLLKKEKYLSENEITRNDESYPYWLATIRYGLYDVEANIKWVDETIENIKAWQKQKEEEDNEK